jgi:L-cysteine desulfidase
MYLQTLKNELKPALGCTEPIAIALAVSKAKDLIKEEIKKIELEVSPNVIKNAMGVGIPGTDMIGINIAALLGFVAGNSEKGLRVLEDINENDIKKAISIKEKNIIKLNKYEGDKKLFIEARLYCENENAVVRIENLHDTVTYISHNGVELFKEAEEVFKNGEQKSNLLKLEDIYEFALNANVEDLKFLYDGVKLNMDLAKDGLTKDRGLKAGKTYSNNIEKGYLSKDFKNISVMNVAAAVDSRMAGSPLPAMSNSGSGDQGITAIVPVYSAWKELGLDEEHLLRALALSNLIPIHIKHSLGRLSALCGATIASIGVSVAITYMLGGDFNTMKRAINNNIGGLAGLFCDGAKNSCALKAANSVDAAFTSAFCAMDGNGVTGLEGIVDDDPQKSILNLTNLGKDSMLNVDRDILEIMIKKFN